MVTRMYTAQLARLDRMYKFTIQDERFKTLDNNLQADIILSFLMHCYHLKDYLKQSGVYGKKVEGYVDKTRELRDCGDLTNSTKHLSSRKQLIKHKRKRSPKGSRIHLPKLYDWRTAGVPSPISRSYDYFAKDEEEREVLVISIDGEERRCFDFMQRCMEKWNEFLDKEGLDRNIT